MIAAKYVGRVKMKEKIVQSFDGSFENKVEWKSASRVPAAIDNCSGLARYFRLGVFSPLNKVPP